MCRVWRRFRGSSPINSDESRIGQGCNQEVKPVPIKGTSHSDLHRPINHIHGDVLKRIASAVKKCEQVGAVAGFPFTSRNEH